MLIKFWNWIKIMLKDIPEKGRLFLVLNDINKPNKFIKKD